MAQTLQASKKIDVWRDKTITCYTIICSSLIEKASVTVRWDPARTNIIQAIIRIYARASANSGITVRISNPYVEMHEVLGLYWYVWEGQVQKTQEADITNILYSGENIVTLQLWRGWFNLFTINATFTLEIEIIYAGEEPQTLVTPIWLSWIEKLLEYWPAIPVGAMVALAIYGIASLLGE